MNLLFQNIPAAKYCRETVLLEAASFSRDNKIVNQVARIRRIMELITSWGSKHNELVFLVEENLLLQLKGFKLASCKPVTSVTIEYRAKKSTTHKLVVIKD